MSDSFPCTCQDAVCYNRFLEVTDSGNNHVKGLFALPGASGWGGLIPGIVLVIRNSQSI